MFNIEHIQDQAMPSSGRLLSLEKAAGRNW